jgi:NAD(P)-dependent dehydrogenase (short-subunit alcohol dehydrogenase family)
MNNAGVGNNPGKPWENLDAWKNLIDVNFWGVVQGVQAFGGRMLAQGTPAMIVNTGSKQGITTPPGNLAYNVSKSALKTYTEGLAHALRNEPGANISAHLLIPGFTFTGLTAGASEKPAAAWTPAEVVDFMLQGLSRDDFYILCPDNETPRTVDERRMAWAIGDVIENRPALSRWHPDYKDAFEDFVKG